jgi:hypothetical protein
MVCQRFVTGVKISKRQQKFCFSYYSPIFIWDYLLNAAIGSIYDGQIDDNGLSLRDCWLVDESWLSVGWIGGNCSPLRGLNDDKPWLLFVWTRDKSIWSSVADCSWLFVCTFNNNDLRSSYKKNFKRICQKFKFDFWKIFASSYGTYGIGYRRCT